MSAPDGSSVRSNASRRSFVAGATALAAAGGVRAAEPEAVRIKAEGRERQLPSRMLGLNTPCVYDIPYEDPKAVAAIKATAPNIVRFPGGTVGNYYNWRIGFMEVPDGPGASVYRKLLINSSVPASKRLHPQGVFIDDWMKVVRELDADLVLNPNLETSTVDEQRAWFADMHRKGIVPRNIEMGTEFFLAMFMDPMTLAVVPDWPTTIRRTREYHEAFKPYLPKDAKIAVQSASSRFRHLDPMASPDKLIRHEAEWDRDMKPEPWFDAVTTHLYPGLEASAGPGSLKRLPGDALPILGAMLARADDGYDRTLSDTIAKMPGKEIWMTEWGPFESAQTLGGQPAYFNGMWLHMVTRAQMSMLRHPQLTMANCHAGFFRGDMMSGWVRDGQGGYIAINASTVLHWFFAASRGPDAHYQRLSVEGAQRLSSQSTVPGERFWDVDACLFRQGRKRTLFVHNAWTAAKAVDLSGVVGPRAPVSAEVVDTPDLMVDLQKGAPKPRPLAASGGPLAVPAHSVTRVTWTA